MISALLSNTPVSTFRGSTNAGDRRFDPDEQQLQRGQENARQSEADPRSQTGQRGNVPPLSAEAVVALQSAEKTNSLSSGQSAGKAQSGGSEGDNDGDGLSEAEEKQVDKLRARDREVRAHEQAHARVGGAYASAPSYTFQQGPDGKRYAVGGEVQIDTAKERTPERTIRKMQVVIRAALAPAEPSSQDLKVAQQARASLSEAQTQLRQQKTEELRGGDEAEVGEITSVAPDQAVQSSDPSAEVGGAEKSDEQNSGNVARPDFVAAYNRANEQQNRSGPGSLTDVRVA